MGLQSKASSFLHSQLIGSCVSQLMDTNAFPSLETYFELHTHCPQASFTKHHNDKLLRCYVLFRFFAVFVCLFFASYAFTLVCRRVSSHNMHII